MLIFNDKLINTDEYGYLTNSTDWSKMLALLLAEQENIILTELHWEIIYFIRDFYQKYNISPTIRILVIAIKQKFGKLKGNSRYLYRLFPKGPAKQATKIAGLPKPIKCI
ncbi:TusE/DsrC/DsvC family sulfur relay protein [Candidatus Fukatsuia anoeciicola]|uniref:TusE/DsrC/DsvC family sulfur relay protein n=1 Tax=Candidatus Fukatsuia anoeciicola TaxID=2994492 RepID=UPI0034641F32